MRHPLYVVEQGCKVNRESRRLIVTRDEAVITRAPVIQLSQVIVFGNVQFTTPALKLLLDEGVEVVLLSRYGRFYGRLVGPTTGHGALRVAQIVRSRDADYALRTAQSMVEGKVRNLRVFLQRYARRMDSSDIHAAADAIDLLLPRIHRTTVLNSLLGVEGQATAIYFGVWKNLLKPPWRFDRRNRRPPADPVNVLLSLGYTLLQQNVLGAVLAAGLDPYVGFLHQLDYNRPSLALDLMEEFRPLIVDSVALRCLNNEILTPDHFTPGDDPQRPIVLSEIGVRLFIRELETRLTQTFKHPQTGEQITYRRLFHLQAYDLAAALELDTQNRDAPERVYRPFIAR
jgi:CRISP-associated protein Cas1